jgi:hypothetical protein
MRNLIQLLGGVAVAGVVAAGSTAFTAAGLTSTVNTAGTTVFAGGSVTQTVVGGVLTNVTTASIDASGTQINQFTLQFNSDTPAGRPVTLTTNGTATVAGGITPTAWFCQQVQADHSAICKSSDTAYASPGGYYAGITTMTVTVS